MKLKAMTAKVLGSELVFVRDFKVVYFKVFEKIVVKQKFNGQNSKPFKFITFDRGNSVTALIQLMDTKEIVLARQYRAGTDRYEIDLPAGMVDKGEKPEEAVIREVAEETGYEILSRELIRHLGMSPGSYTEESDLFYLTTASDLKTGLGGGLVGESEDIEVLLVSPEEAWAWVEDGTITDAKTVVALQWLKIKSLTE